MGARAASHVHVGGWAPAFIAGAGAGRRAHRVFRARAWQARYARHAKASPESGIGNPEDPESGIRSQEKKGKRHHSGGRAQEGGESRGNEETHSFPTTPPGLLPKGRVPPDAARHRRDRNRPLGAQPNEPGRRREGRPQKTGGNKKRPGKAEGQHWPATDTPTGQERRDPQTPQ